MDCRDIATSRVKRKRMKRHQSDLDLRLQMRFIGFNLSPYNSFDERLRLNHLKMIHRQTRVPHVHVALNEPE